MKHEFDQKGNLVLAVDGIRSKERMETIKDRVGGNDICALNDVLDIFGFTGNAILYPVRPENVGALTDAPMLSDDVLFNAAGKMIVRGKVWWFPQYESKNWLEALLETGRVKFTLAGELA